MDNRQFNYSIEEDGCFRLEVSARKVISPTNITGAYTQSYYYNRAIERMEVSKTAVCKVDNRIPVSPGATVSMDIRSKVSYPLRSEERALVLKYANVKPGDIVIYDLVHERQKPLEEGFFAASFVTSGNRTDLTVNISTPPGMKLFIHHSNGNYSCSVDQYKSMHTWRSTTETGANILTDAASFFASTHTAEELANLISSIIFKAISRAEVITKLAREISQGATDERATARKIYEWVSTNIVHSSRLLAGMSAIPTSPLFTIATRSGDVRDCIILLGSLLEAADIAFEVVLVSGRNEMSAGTVATLEVFSELCIWLPKSAVYLDPVGMTTFGQVSLALSGRAAFRVGRAGNTERATIAENVEVLSSRVEIILDVKSEGLFSGVAHVTGSGWFGAECRRKKKVIAFETKNRSLLDDLFFDQHDGPDHHSFSATFVTGRSDSWLSQGVPLPMLGLDIPRVGDILLYGKPSNVMSGGIQEEIVRLRLGDGVSIASLPKNYAVACPLGRYISTWAYANGEVTVSRLFLPIPLENERWDAKVVEEFLAKIRMDYAQTLKLGYGMSDLNRRLDLP